MHRLLTILALLIPIPIPTNAQTPTKPTPKTWPSAVQKVEIPVSDNTTQFAMWYAPQNPQKKPLLVGLHTWSSNYASAGGDAIYAEWCIDQGWAFIHPDFRGPNKTPQAMGSDRAVQDIIEAVAWAKQQTDIDPTRIYLVGVSGGGHMALLMAGRHPEIWAGVSAWCGISDIAKWHQFHTKDPQPTRYGREMETALGGSPTQFESAKKSALHRSPNTWLTNAKNVPLDINHGIQDGRTGSVPFTHSLHAFNAAITTPSDRLPTSDIDLYYQTLQLPSHWPTPEPDEVYATWTPLMRKISGQTRITIHKGGHEIVHQAALNWLALQRKNQPAVWKVSPFIPLKTIGTESAK